MFAVSRKKRYAPPRSVHYDGHGAFNTSGAVNKASGQALSKVLCVRLHGSNGQLGVWETPLIFLLNSWTVKTAQQNLVSARRETFPWSRLQTIPSWLLIYCITAGQVTTCARHCLLLRTKSDFQPGAALGPGPLFDLCFPAPFFPPWSYGWLRLSEFFHVDEEDFFHPPSFQSSFHPDFLPSPVFFFWEEKVSFEV